MFDWKPVQLVLVCLLSGLGSGAMQTAHAASQFNEPRQVTTNPGDDFAPALTANGQAMVYVSDQSGNLDLWVKQLTPGVPPPDRQLTRHSSSDNSPAVSPDGKWVAFVSHRSDPKGDIYLVPLKIEASAEDSKNEAPAEGSIEVEVLTNPDFPESDPIWSPDQKYIYFTSVKPETREPWIYRLEVASKKRTAVSTMAGVNPGISPDNKALALVARGKQSGIWVQDLATGKNTQLTSGRYMELAPRFSPDGKRIYFTRYQDDTNKDGKVTINDRPNLWFVEYLNGAAGRERQLTDSSTYDLQPVMVGDRIYFTSTRKGGTDIWDLHPEGLLPSSTNYGQELQTVEDLCDNDSLNPYLCLLADNALVHDFPGEKTLSRIQYRQAKGYQALGHLKKAGAIFRSIIQTYPDDRLYRGLSEIELLLVDVAQAKDEGKATYRERNQKALASLKPMIEAYADQPRVLARAWLESGHFHYELEEFPEALGIYKKVMTDYASQRPMAAEAAFSLSKVYKSVGDQKSLVNAFVNVVKDYYDVNLWTRKAINEILAIYEGQPTLSKKVSSLHDLAEVYQKLPRLAGAVQNRIGELYYNNGENLLSKEAYQRTIDRYPGAPGEQNTARFALAGIFAEEENFEMSLAKYQEVTGGLGDLQEAKADARRGYIRKSLDKGEWELRVGEAKLARKTFLKLMEFSPETVEAHRGYILAEATIKQAPRAIAFYEEKVKSPDVSTVNQYALGLAYTYLAPPDLDTSEKWIRTALARNSNNVFYHQTMGWIFEQRERAKSGKGFLENAIQSYQKALALNDASEDPQNQANLQLNLGNGNYSLNNFYTAYHYYDQRKESGRPFLDAKRETLFYQRFGESAFKSGFPLKAVDLFKESLKRVEGEHAIARMAELNDRIALAYQDAGRYAQAVEYFSKTLELHQQTGNAVSVSRALRNIANNLYALNEKKEGQNAASLNRALGNYFEAIDQMKQHGTVATKEGEKKGGGFLDVSIQTGLDENASQAAFGFDKIGEQKLIFHYIGKIFGDFGDYDQAIVYFKKKLELIADELDPVKHLPVILEKALLLNQVGHFQYLAGRMNDAQVQFKQSYALSKLIKNKQGVGVNASNLARIVVLQSRTHPISEMVQEINQVIAELKEAEALLDADPATLSNPEYRVFVKNYLGILHHYLAFHIPEPNESASSNSENAVQASLARMDQEFNRSSQSRTYFKQAMDAANVLEPGLRARIENALVQNLELTQYILGKDKTEPTKTASVDKEINAPSNPPLFSKWQFKFLESVQVDGDERLALLEEADRLLSQLPYGASRGPASLSMQEDLYRSLTDLLFDKKKFADALHFSEKGLQQTLVALREKQSLTFKDENRQAMYSDLRSYADQVSALSKKKDADPNAVAEEADALMAEYAEYLMGVNEEDPVLVGLLSPKVPSIEEVQSLLRPEERLVKFELMGNHLLLWILDNQSIRGGRTVLPGDIMSVIQRVSEYGAKVTAEDIVALSKTLIAPLASEFKDTSSLILIAGGRLEFLPWAGMQLEGGRLIQKVSLSFQTSLAQYFNSETGKNLYNARMLAVEVPSENFNGVKDRFASAENLIGEQGTVAGFTDRAPYFGVVAVDSPTVAGGPDPAHSFISLTSRPNHYERLEALRLLEQSTDSHFIALGDVRYQFRPETSVSPTAALVQALNVRGYPGVLLHTGPVDPALHAEFQKLFYQNFRKGNPAESLRSTQVQLAEKYPQSAGWADYRYYGFPGMTEEEKNDFAQGRFQENVQGGIKNFQEANWLGAISHFEKALVLVDFLEDKSMAPKLTKTLAQAAYNLGDFKKSIHYQKQVVALAKQSEDPEQLAEAMFFLGILYSRDEDFTPAVAHLKEALAFYEEYEILDKLAESYSTLGIVEENALDYDNALQAFSASLKINEEIGEDINKGKELRRIGRIYYLRLSNYPQATAHFRQAYELFLQLDVPEQLVESLLELGLVEEKQANFDQALNYYSQAQKVAEEKDLQLQLSKAFLYQGNSHWYMGNYQNAFRFQKQALEIAKAINDKRQQAFIYNTLGLIYWTLNDSRRALDNMGTSKKLAEEIQSLLDVATAYNNMGLVYRKDKKYEKSIELFNEALTRDVQLKSKWGQGYTHRNMGMSYLRMKKLDEAEPHIKKAIQLSGEINNHTNLVKSKLELGNLALERNQCEQAVPVFKETETLATRYRIREVEWRAMRGQGFCLEKANRRAEAIAAYKRAVDVVDSMRAAIKVEEFQNGFLTDKQDVYKELIILLLNSGQVEESFNYAERAKSRSFIDLLGNQKISLKDEVSQALYDRLNAQKKLIRETEERLGKTEGEEAVKQVQAELIKARTGYQDLLIEAKQQSPQVSNFITVDSITLDKLYQLMEADMALVEFLVAENELIAWVITKGNIKVVRTPGKETDLKALISDYRNRMQNLAPLEEQSKQLYAHVMGPVAPLVSDKRVLGIIPHGHLHYLSFSSLNDGTAYLIERHPLFFSPSASVLEFTFKRKTERKGPAKVLALGNPDLGSLNYDLPLAELEAKAIQWDFPEVTILTRDKATESWLQKNISQYEIIHIASHGEFDPINPLFSSLKLAKDEEADGNFEVNEVFSLDIQADLVTLSACQTGLGEITGGDELVGLNRAFIYAGTHSILSSLWRVSDISTAVLIKHFYRNYSSENKGESLRKAQLLVKRLYPHPSYWAGFTLTGDYR